jgi:hypothetical protein
MKKSLEIVLILIVLALTIIHLTSYIFTSNELNYFNTNTLINYSQGFVRRGLSGELIKSFSIVLHLNPLVIIKVFNLILIFIIFTYFIKTVIHYKLSFTFFLFPFVLPFLIIDDIINFKDLFTLVFFILLVKVTFSNSKQKLWKFFLLNIIGSIAILNHEMSFFIFIPSIILIRYLIIPKIGELLKTIVFMIPTFIILYLCIYYSGTTVQETNILSSYSYLPNNNVNIDQLSHRAVFLLPDFFTQKIWNGFSRGVTTLFFFIQVVFLLAFYDKIKTSFTKFSHSLNSSLLVFTYLFLFICFLPIFFIAYDWHRFLYLILISSFIISIEFYKIEKKTNRIYRVPFWIQNPGILLSNTFSYFIIPERSLLIIIGFFGIIPHMKMGNVQFQFSSLLLILMNYTTKITSLCFN